MVYSSHFFSSLVKELELTRLANLKAKSRLETRRTRSTASLKRRF